MGIRHRVGRNETHRCTDSRWNDHIYHSRSYFGSRVLFAHKKKSIAAGPSEQMTLKYFGRRRVASPKDPGGINESIDLSRNRRTEERIAAGRDPYSAFSS